MFAFLSKAPPNPPAMPAGRRVYAIGDIHGQYNMLCTLLDAVERDNALRGPAETTVVLLGDLIDRGSDSSRVVDLAMKPLGWAEVRVLLGNHEAALVEGLGGDERMLGVWIQNGGNAALASWGFDLDMLEQPGEDLIERIVAAIPAEQLAWLRRLPLSTQIGDYLFVHAGIRPGVPLDQQSAHDLLWIREPFLTSRRHHGAMIVHGHTVKEEVDEQPNRIGLDTGAYLTGRLTAMGFEMDERWVLAT